VSHGRRVAVALPEDSDMQDYFQKVGWLDGIEGTPSPPYRHGSTFVPLSKFSTYPELNGLVNDAVTLLVERDVLPPGVRQAVEWTLNEIADNVLNHAATDEPGWLEVTAYTQNQKVDFVVVDTGRGIRGSLLERFPELEDDGQAISLAVEKGITRNREKGQGNGLSGMVRIASSAGGWATIHSGKGALMVRDGSLHGPEEWPGHRGTIVTVSIPTSRPIDLEESLWGKPVTPAFDFDYVKTEGIVIAIAKEASNFGNRETARNLRNKVLNLLQANPDERLIVDFDGVEMITASFADEFLAKLACDMGVVVFFGKCVLMNMNRFIQSTVNQVIHQRIAAAK
jgi:hypothetical protein